MKNLHKLLLILLIANLGFAQSSKTIFSEQGITVSYNLSKAGTTTNTKTGTVFCEYKLVTTITNGSSKYWAYGPGCSLKVENASSNSISPSDEKFCKNNGRANVDHFCIEDNCNNFPQVSGMANPHQVICPNSTQKCELKFLHPDGLAGDPKISWWGWQFKEQIGEMTNKPQNVKQANSSNNKVEITNKKPQELQTKKSIISDHDAKYANVSSISNSKKGVCYQHGLEGYPKDFSQAIIYYEKAIKEGDKDTAYILQTLGYMHRDGQGVAQNNQIALDYFKKACDLNPKVCSAYTQLKLKLN